MFPGGGGNDEEIRYTIALEGAAQAGEDFEKLIAKAKEFNTEVATAIALVKELMEQFSGKGGAQPQLPEFQQAFQGQLETQSNVSLSAWQKAVEEITKMNQGVKTYSDYITTMTASLMAAEQASKNFGTEIDREAAKVQNLGTQTADTIAKLQQLGQQLGTGVPELKATQPTEIIQPKVNPEVLQEAANQIEHLTKAETDLVEVNKKVEASTPKVIEKPSEPVQPVSVPVITAEASAAVDTLKKKEDELKTSSQQLVQPLEQVNQASKDAQGGSENLTLGLSKLGEQTKLTKQGVVDLNKAIESQPKMPEVIPPEVAKPTATPEISGQAVAALEELNQKQGQVATSAGQMAQAENIASQATGNLGTSTTPAVVGMTEFQRQVEITMSAVREMIRQFGEGTPAFQKAFDAAKLRSTAMPGVWEEALNEINRVKQAAAEYERVRLDKPFTQAAPAVDTFKGEVESLLNILRALSESGSTIPDFEKLIGKPLSAQFSPEVITEAFKQAEAAGIRFGNTIQGVMQQDQLEINRAKKALQELASTKMTTPVQAAQTPEFQQLGFNPAVVRAGMEELGTSFDKTAVRKDAFKVNLQTLWATFKQGATPIQGIKNAFNLLVQGFSTGGGLISAVIGGVLGFSLVGIVQGAIRSIGSLIQSLNQAAEASLAFLDSTFKLEIGLRDAQRKGFDATREELVQFSKDFKEKYPMFSNVAIRKGLADMIFYTKELGVNAKDSFALFDASATLAIATGKEVSEVMRMIALAASSGYSEGLQRMGLNINKVTITERAHAMGIKETYMQMNQEQRAAALLNLVLEQTAGISKDAAEKQKTLAGWAETVAAKQTDAATQLGKAWLPFKTFFDDVGRRIQQQLADILSKITGFVADVVGAVYGVQILLDKIFSGEAAGKNFADVIAESMNEGFDAAAKKLGTKEFYFDAQAELALNLNTVGLDEDQKQKVYDSVDSFIENLEKSVTDYQDGQKEAAQKYQDDLVKIEQDGLEKRAQLDEEYAQKQKDIEFNLEQDIEKARLDLQRDLADINLKASQDETKAKEDAKQKELDLEKEYADKVAKLQRDLEFDLEEAVRARDATAVRRLKREYGKNLTELDIQKQNDKAQIQHDLQLRLQEIQQRRALDIQQRQVDFAQKMADLQTQAALERQQALDNYNKDLVDLQKSLAQQRNERKKAYNDQLKDLYDAFTKRLKMASEALAKEVGMNAQAAQAIASYLVALYGPNGVFERVYDYMIAYINGGKDQILKSLGNLNLGVSKQAEGGDYLVKHPTLFLAGEKGAEEAHFWPVNKPIPMPLASTGKVSSEQYLRVMVDLGPDLVGKIVDKSLDEFADVLVRSG